MDRLHDDVATHTGVSAADVKKVLDHLGLSAVSREVETSIGKDKVSSIKAGQLKLAVRLGKSSIAV